MAKQTISIGTSANDRTGSTGRAAFDICNDNFTELYGFTAVGATSAATPTEAELIAVLGTAAANGAGWSDRITTTNGGTTYYWYVWTDGTSYILHAGTLAS